MLTTPKKLLQGFCLLASQTPYLEFHTSAYALKGGSRKKKIRVFAKADAQPARSSSRKRLAPTLKPDRKSGTYEVAPQPSKSRDERPHRRDERDNEDEAFLSSKSIMAPKDTQEEPLVPPQTAFSREDAPHVGRKSWQPPSRAAMPNKLGRLDYGNGFDKRTSPFYGTRGTDIISRRWDKSRNTPRREETSQTSSSRRTFRDRLSSEEKITRARHAYDSGDGFDRPWSSKVRLPEEFHTPQTEPLKTLPTHFTSPPLLNGLLRSVHEVLGSDARPSPIQSLSLKHLFNPPPHILSTNDYSSKQSPASAWGQYLLASETGSGKSIAYLLPMIQYLKLTEGSPSPLPPSLLPPPVRSLSLNPRGLILAPTHELSRQLSSFAKALLHNVRLRVLCASRANNSSSAHGKNSTASQMKRELDDIDFGITDGTHNLRKNQPVDVLVGTPSKVLEMVRGWGWNREDKIEDQWDDARKDRARNWVPGPPEAALTKVEWVVVDEADVLFDDDFQESTRMLLADIAQARGYSHPSFLSIKNISSPLPNHEIYSQPVEYPFHLILTSATIPSSLASYLTTNHPKLTRLASPNLHRLPSTLKTEHHAYTSGNKNSDIERRIKHVWAEDARLKKRSKILIFCNKSSKVEDLGLYLTEKGIPNVALTSTAEARSRGSNRHLAGFLKATEEVSSSSHVLPVDSTSPASRSEPHVMITTSLLSRGLDFSPQIKHIFIVDEPRNMIDFLHRAGRSGRAGNEGKVVVFGKMKGRGSDNTRDMKRKIGALAH